MNINANIVDLLIGILLIMAVPALVANYLKGFGSSRSLMVKISVIGILWIVFAMVSEELLEAVSTFERADSYAHEGMAERLMMGREPAFFDSLPTGNKAYQTFVYGFFLMGAYIPSVRAVNAFCAFWGGLIVASYLLSHVAWERRRSLMIMATIFFPSTVFWSSGNLKEGLTYFGICLMFSASFSTNVRAGMVTPSLLAGAAICGFMRPHMALAWLIAISTVTLMTRGRRLYALVALALVPLLFFKMQSLAQNEFSSVDKTLELLETQSRGLKAAGGSVQSGQQVPIISGLLAIFFRPFPWESRSFFMTICALEIWALTLTMIRAWTRLSRVELKLLLRSPSVRVAFLVLMITSVLFSYLPNDGLLARQRVQVVPAMMILTILPLSIRSYLKNTQRIMNERAAARRRERFQPAGFPQPQFTPDGRNVFHGRGNQRAPT